MTDVLENNPAKFQLVYLGPSDDSPKTLQLIKGVFIADLELEIPAVQQILEAIPATIKESVNKSDLKHAYQLLRGAGALVEIVDAKPQETTSADLEEHYGQKASGDVPLETQSQDDNESIEFEVVLEETPPQQIEVKQPKKVYEINLDEASDAPLFQFNNTIEDTETEPPEASDTSQPLASMLSAQESEELKTRQKQLESAAIPAASLEFDSDASGSVPNPITQPQKTQDNIPSAEATFDFILDETKPITKASEPISKNKEATPKPPSPSALEDSDLTISFDDEVKSSSVQPKSAIENKELTPQKPPSLLQAGLETTPAKAEVIDNPPPSPDPDLDIAPLEEDLPKEPSSEIQISPALSTTEVTVPSQLKEREEAPPSEIQKHIEPSPEASSSPMDESLETESAQVSHHKKRLQQEIVAYYVIPIIIGSIIMFAGTYFYYSDDGGESLTASIDINSISQQSESSSSISSGPPLVEEEAIPKATTYEAINENEQRKLNVKISSDDKDLTNISISIVRPSAPEPTKEQIVQDTVLPPWLNKIEIRELPLVSLGNGEYSAEGPSTAWVEYAKNKNRSVGTAKIQAQFSEDRSKIRVSMVAKSSDVSDSGDNIQWVENRPSGGHRFFFSDTAETTKK